MKKYFEKYKVDCGFTQAPDGNAADIRKAMADKADLNGGIVVRAKLVHGIDICVIDEEALGMGSYIEIDDCDGLLTNMKNVTLTTTHGDCIPLFAIDPKKHVIGIAHAGWRGTADCIASALIYWMQEVYKCKTKDIQVVVGPGIGACCFEVDEDVVDYFTEEMPWTEEYMYRCANKKYRVDLQAINAELFQIEGIPEDNIFMDPDCTCCKENADKYFSHRRDKDPRRMLAYIRQ